MRIKKHVLTWALCACIFGVSGCVSPENEKDEGGTSDFSENDLILLEDKTEPVQGAGESVVSDGSSGEEVSDIEEGYYGDTYELTGEELKASLNDIISEGHVALSYDQVYSALEDTDEDLEDPSKVVLFYKGVLVDDNYKRTSDDGDIWNREHIWAKSHGDFGTYRGPGTDLHMIRPTDASVNARRGHLDFDESDNPLEEVAGTYVDKDSFEPRDEVKGDVARMLFYMAVRYEGEDGEVDLELTNRVDTYFQTETGYGEHGKLDTLLSWHLQDPVDTFESIRNERIYKIQGNRNPFIDHPEFVAMIWQESDIVSNPTVTEESSSQVSGAQSTTIEEVRYMDDGKTGTITGVVTFIESETTLYVQDGDHGVRVDSHGSSLDLTNYQPGQVLMIIGQVTTYKGEKELRVTKASQLTEVGSDDTQIASPSSLLEISDGEKQGLLIKVQNLTVTSTSNYVFEVEDEDGYRMTVYITEGSGTQSDEIQVGHRLDIIGIPSMYNDVQIKLVEIQ